jgi:D-alanine-D-alanine ligase-like ATP-grasp enzyme
MALHLTSAVVLHSDAKREYFPTQEAFETEKYAKRDAVAIASYLRSFVKKVTPVAVDRNWVKKILTLKPDVIINVVDSVHGDDTKTPLVCATLEMLGIPFTGNGLGPVYECYNKYAVKEKLKKHNLPTPKGFIVSDSKAVQIPKSIRYPVIVKLNSIHGSVGLSNLSIVKDEKTLLKQIRLLLETYQSDVLVEEYIVGTEISAFVFESANGLQVCMTQDILNGGTDPYAIASYEFRWVEENPQIETKKYINPAIESIMKTAFIRFGMKGYSKFDARVSKGIPYIIDVNPNPAFGPPENDSPFAKMAESLYGIRFPTLLSTIVSAAFKK